MVLLGGTPKTFAPATPSLFSNIFFRASLILSLEQVIVVGKNDVTPLLTIELEIISSASLVASIVSEPSKP